MLVLFFLLIFIILGIYFSKLKFVVKKFNFEMNSIVSRKKDYEIKAGIYLYGKIKILGIVFEEDCMRFFCFKIPYKQLKKIKLFKKIIEEEKVDLDKKTIYDEVKNLNMRFEKLNLNLIFGTDSNLITSFLTFVVSTLMSFLIQNSVSKYKPNKHKFIITPIYENQNSIKLSLEMIACFNLKNVLKVLYDLNKLSKIEHIKHKIKFKEIKI